MAETSSQQCLSALCNAGDSVNLRSLHDHFRYLKVSMIWLREVRRSRKYLYLLMRVHGGSAWRVRSKGAGMSGQGFISQVHLMTRHNHMSHWSLGGDLGVRRTSNDSIHLVSLSANCKSKRELHLKALSAAVVHIHIRSLQFDSLDI